MPSRGGKCRQLHPGDPFYRENEVAKRVCMFGKVCHRRFRGCKFLHADQIRDVDICSFEYVNLCPVESCPLYHGVD